MTVPLTLALARMGCLPSCCCRIRKHRKLQAYITPAKPLLTFSFTESQRDALAFAALCEAEDLQEGDEADELEVQEAIGNLWEAHKVLNGGRYE